MKISILNPLRDSRWHELVSTHPDATVFHSRAWIEALVRTYKYEPLVLTSAPSGQPLTDGLVLCKVSSWITGTRLVSMPFADHCQPLLSDPEGGVAFANWLEDQCDLAKWKYAEIRPLSTQRDVHGWQPAGSYCFHELDLSLNAEKLFHRMHKNSFQRKVRRAEREKLSYVKGQTQQLVSEFYELVVTTRRRHRLLPQPRRWFRNLVDAMGNNVEIRVVRKESTPIAAMLTLRHRNRVVFKYGCSNSKYHNLGGMPFLFWRLIEESKMEGADSIDLGRSDFENPGLITFKDRLGSLRKRITYYRHTGAIKEKSNRKNWFEIGEILFTLPDAVLSTAGSVLYRHMG